MTPPWLRLWARGLGDVFFPPSCAHCRSLVEPGDYRHLCAACAERIEFAAPPFCATCGRPWPGAGMMSCPDCSEGTPAFGSCRVAVRFRGPARSLLLELKYRRGLHVLADVEAIFRRSPAVLEHARGAVLAPVPLHPRKQRERGYNQSALIAAALARAAGGGARVRSLLRRVADTPSQTGLDRRARRDNPKNAFALASGADLNPALRILIVDDVFTTGSTLNSCARVLRRAGCLNLGAAAFGHG